MSDSYSDQGFMPDGGSGDGTDRMNPVYVYWMKCSECTYETIAHGRVCCGDCGHIMKPTDIAGAVVDNRSIEPGTDQEGTK